MATAEVIYAKARELITTLNACGETTLSETLTEVIDGGSTGSEIMMGLRWHLTNALAQGIPEPADHDTRLLVQAIEDTMNSAG